jgi:hypothetical protein
LPATRSGSRFDRKPYETPTCNPLLEAQVVERLGKLAVRGLRPPAVAVVAVHDYSDTLNSLARAVDEVFQARSASQHTSGTGYPGPPVIIVVNLLRLETCSTAEGSSANHRSNVWSIKGAAKATGIAAAVAALWDLGRDELHAAKQNRGERND